MTRWYAVPDTDEEYICILPSPGASEDEAIAFLPRGYDEEQQRNAELIAKAPALEAALRAILDSREQTTRGHGGFGDALICADCPFSAALAAEPPS